MQRRTHGDPEVTLEMVTDHGVHQEEVLTVVILATDQGASPEVEATTTDGMIVVEHLGEVARVQGVHQEEVLTVVIVAADQGASPEVEATTTDGMIIVEHPGEVARDQGVGRRRDASPYDDRRRSKHRSPTRKRFDRSSKESRWDRPLQRRERSQVEE